LICNLKSWLFGICWASLQGGADSYREALRHLDENRPEAARGLLEARLSDHPGDGRSLLALGIACRRLGEMDQARSVYLRALQCEPREARLRSAFNLARMQYEIAHSSPIVRPEQLIDCRRMLVECLRIEPSFVAAQRAVEVVSREIAELETETHEAGSKAPGELAGNGSGASSSLEGATSKARDPGSTQSGVAEQSRDPVAPRPVLSPPDVEQLFERLARLLQDRRAERIRSQEQSTEKNW